MYVKPLAATIDNTQLQQGTVVVFFPYQTCSNNFKNHM